MVTHPFEKHPLWKALKNPNHEIHKEIDVTRIAIMKTGSLCFQLGARPQGRLREAVEKLLTEHDPKHLLQDGGVSNFDSIALPHKVMVRVRILGSTASNSDLELAFGNTTLAKTFAEKLKNALSKSGREVTIRDASPYFPTKKLGSSSSFDETPSDGRSYTNWRATQEDR